MRYTLTARLETKWRWAEVQVQKGVSRASVIRAAQKVIERKSNDEDPATAALWQKGGITLTNGNGHIIWSRSVVY